MKNKKLFIQLQQVNGSEARKIEESIIDEVRDLVYYYAHKYSTVTNKFSVGDLVQESYIKLIKAIRNVDVDKHLSQIMGYLSLTIRGRMQELVYRKSWSTEGSGGGISEEFTLNKDEGLEPKGSLDSPDRELTDAYLKELLYRGVKEQLTDKQEKYIIEVYGLGPDKEPKSRAEVGRMFDNNRKNVSEVVLRAEQKLKEWFHDHDIKELPI